MGQGTSHLCQALTLSKACIVAMLEYRRLKGKERLPVPDSSNEASPCFVWHNSDKVRRSEQFVLGVKIIVWAGLYSMWHVDQFQRTVERSLTFLQLSWLLPLKHFILPLYIPLWSPRWPCTVSLPTIGMGCLNRNYNKEETKDEASFHNV